MDAAATASARPGPLTSWWAYVLVGIGLFVLGLWAFVFPERAFLGLTVWFTLFILLNGAASAFFALSNRRRLGGWGWLLALGLAEVGLGLYLLARPVLAAGVLALFFGFWVLLRSFSVISGAFVLRRRGYRFWGWNLVPGLLGGLLGLLIVVHPVIGALGAATWLALASVVLGLGAFAQGLRLRLSPPARA